MPYCRWTQRRDAVQYDFSELFSFVINLLNTISEWNDRARSVQPLKDSIENTEYAHIRNRFYEYLAV